MTKDAESNTTDSEAGSLRPSRVNKLATILCPTACALLLICVFVISFVGTKMAYDRYDAFCNRRYNVNKLYIFPNETYENKSSLISH